MNDEQPVIMIVHARISAPERYRQYAEAVRDAGLLERYGAVRLSGAPLVEMLEGVLGDGESIGALEFPSYRAARAFWDSPEYRRIVELRAGAGEFRIGLWPKAPPPRLHDDSLQ